MDQQYSTSKVTVEYFDPHDIYKLLAPGLIPLLPLRNLHWKSHAGPPRSINTLHIDLVPSGGAPPAAAAPILSPVTSPQPKHAFDSPKAGNTDGFQTQTIGGRSSSTDHAADPQTSATRQAGRERRHQIPGLRRTPYLKLLLVRCDDNDSYKSQVRSEIRDWVKQNTQAAQGGKKASVADNHDAFEWLIVHVIIPNTVAATQPRTTGRGDSAGDAKVASRWRASTTTLLEKMMADFNNTTKGQIDRVAQIRIGINDVPYDILPRVVPAVPSGYTETSRDVEDAWADLIAKMKAWILSSFDIRVSQYEEDIKEKDAQRSLPGWNFCTFFILKEGLARGFESVGLVEDALVGYDELSVGLDAIVQDQAVSGSAEAHGGALLDSTGELSRMLQRAVESIPGEGDLPSDEDEEHVDLQAGDPNRVVAAPRPEKTDGLTPQSFDQDIPISASKKPYRELILANNVSIFDFRCYIFARQIALLFRLGNATATREELLAKTREQQESLLHGVAPRTAAFAESQPQIDAENLSMLAEVCRRTLEFIPAVSQVMRKDIQAAVSRVEKLGATKEMPTINSTPAISDVVDNMISSFAFSVAQQILAQTSTKALPIPIPGFSHGDAQTNAAIPDPQSIMHPTRSSSLHSTATPSLHGLSNSHPVRDQFLKVGLEELAARRAELYTLSRNVLEECGKKRGWSDGWDSVPVVGESDSGDMVDVDLNDEHGGAAHVHEGTVHPTLPAVRHTTSLAGLDNSLLSTAIDNKADFYRLYETLTLKALRHYVVANHTHSVKANMIDLAVLKYHLLEFGEAASYFVDAIPFFAERGWSLLELSLLVMYSRCLQELDQKDDYVKVALKLLSKAALAEHVRLRQLNKRLNVEVGSDYPSHFIAPVSNPKPSAIQGFLDGVLTATKELSHDVLVPIRDFFFDATLHGFPRYHDKRDSFSLTLMIKSLLVDELLLEGATMRMTNIDSQATKDIWLSTDCAFALQPGRNKLEFHSNTNIPGTYQVDQIQFKNHRLVFHYDRRSDSGRTNRRPPDFGDILNDSRVTLIHRADSLDVCLLAARQIQLDKNNSLEVEISTGWNQTMTCDVRIRAATGGLRLLTAETSLSRSLTSPGETLTPDDGGVFHLGSVTANTKISLCFPFTVEQDVSHVAVRVEVAYTTDDGGPTYTLVKTPSVGISLALGVNVQDVFKHTALFSRFTVTTASTSPLRLLGSELLESDMFEPVLTTSLPATRATIDGQSSIVIFREQPASLMFKITRKPGSVIHGPKTRKTMYLKLRYSIVQDEVESLMAESIGSWLEADTCDSESLWPYSRLVTSTVLEHVRAVFASECDLDHALLLGSLSTSFLAGVQWERKFASLGETDYAQRLSSTLAASIRGWQQHHLKLRLEPTALEAERPRSILIPVDVPSITIVHTADIELRPSSRDVQMCADRSSLTTMVNQLIPATLRLKWSRLWDTGDPDCDKPSPPSKTDMEFSYEVTAPQDTWLIGGRRKGHFVIPGLDADADEITRREYAAGVHSTPDTEADIPLLLMPLREGWLPFPAIDIREVRSATVAPIPEPSSQDNEPSALSCPVTHCETDFKNISETVFVTAERNSVTLSLDASGPSGDPLVLESSYYS